MRLLSTVLLVVSSALLPLQAQRPATARASGPLVAGFRTPQPQARLRCYWWWLNGRTNEATITRDLTEMAAKGFGGVLLVDANGANQNGNDNVPAGPVFGSPAWTALYVHALKEADRLGLEVTLNITSGWNLGGPWVKPENASKLLTWSRTTVQSGPAPVRLAAPPAKNGFYREIAVLAYPLHQDAALPGSTGSARKPLARLALKSAATEGGFSMPDLSGLLTDPEASGDPTKEADAPVAEVQDLSGKVDAEGTLRWTPPSGTWEVLRVGYTSSDAKVSTSSGAWQGLAIDYLDPAALDLYWKTSVLPLLKASQPFVGKSLKYLASDSWELGGTNWTGAFREEFRKRRGYDPVPYLPVVAGRIVGSRAESTNFLADLRRTVGDLVNEHYDHLAQLSKPFGLGIECESGGPHAAPLDALETFRSAAIVQTEYWAMSPEHRTRDEERYFVKEAASAAHLYGQRLVAAEGMTSIGNQWSESLGMNLKPSFDHALTEGMNRLVWHEFTSSPPELGLPGQEYFAGTHLNPNVTWWGSAGPFLGYLNRAQFLLQQGQPVSDVLYYYGDQVPNFVRLKRDDPAGVLPGYDYDVTSTDALLGRVSTSKGALRTPEGIGYKVFALPKNRVLPLATLELAQRYAEAGGVVVGARPLRSQGIVPAAEARRFAAVTEAMWGPCEASPGKQGRVGKGQLFCGATAREALGAMGVLPDVEVPAEMAGRLDYVHRRVAENGTEIYFVRNTGVEALSTAVTLRVRGMQPAIFDAATGGVAESALFEETADGRTRIPLALGPYGSVFVVLRPSAGGRRVAGLRRGGKVLFGEGGQGAAELPMGLRVGLAGGKLMLETPEAGEYGVSLAGSSAEKHVRIAPVQAIPLDGAATLRFPMGWGAPAEVKLVKLESWTASPDAGIRYFSGTATYRMTVTLRAEQVAGLRGGRLNLGEVKEVASVRINGQAAGTLWQAPYAADLGESLRVGENVIEVEVTNLWPNRLIGDAQPGVEKRYTWTNIRKYTKDSPLLPSGLLGPVRLEPMYRVVVP